MKFVALFGSVDLRALLLRPADFHIRPAPRFFVLAPLENAPPCTSLAVMFDGTELNGCVKLLCCYFLCQGGVDCYQIISLFWKCCKWKENQLKDQDEANKNQTN